MNDTQQEATVSQPDEDVIGEARRPTAAEEEVFAWAERVATHELRHMNETLRQLALMTPVLLATGIVIWGRLPGATWIKGLAGALMLGSMAIAWRGWLPWSAPWLEIWHLDGAREARVALADRKLAHLRGSTALFLLAFAALLAGAILAP